MPIPPLVVSGDIVSATHINAIRNELVAIRTDMIIWNVDINGGAQTLSNVHITSLTQSWGGNVNGGANTLSNVNITSLTQSWGGNVNANTHSLVNIQQATIAAMGTVAATGALTSANPALLLYNAGGGNWAGLGTDPSGNAYIRTGVGGTGRANFIVNAMGQVELSNGSALGALVYASDSKGLRLTNTGTDYYDVGRRATDGFLVMIPNQVTFSGYALYTKDAASVQWARLVIYNGGHTMIGCPNNIAADTFVPTSCVHFSVDEASNLLRIKVKYSNGTTVKTGIVGLS